jgi:hypothetical protein
MSRKRSKKSVSLDLRLHPLIASCFDVEREIFSVVAENGNNGNGGFIPVGVTSMEAKVHDPVNRPSHYKNVPPAYEAVKVIRAWRLGFELGNALKYIARHTLKGGVEDLEKAAWYLNDYIRQLKGQPTTSDPSKGE